jgi:hypothetical protein
MTGHHPWRRRARLRAALGAMFTLAGAALPLAAQSRDWSPEDRTIIGDFTRINAVATTVDRVFAVTPQALLVLDPQRHQWEGPYLPPDPTLLTDVVAALADPIDNSLWLVRRNGWIRFEPGIRLWDQGFVSGTVVDAALDQNAPAAGLFLRTSSGWFLAGRGGGALPTSAPSRPIRPATVDQAIRDNPAIQANSAGLLITGRFRNIRYTSAAQATGFSGQGWYLGTVGAGLVYFPLGSGFPQQLTFGLPSDAVDAVFAGPTGVWAVTERTVTADAALSFVGADLNGFTWYQGPRATGLPFTQARRVVGQGSSLWLATDVGVVRVTPKGEDIERFDEGRGVPDQRVLDLAQRRGRIVAGTAHGLAAWQDSLGFHPVAPDFTDAALAVELSGDTVWVGTPRGLFAAVPGESDLLQPEALRESLSLQAQVVDLAWRGDTLVALTADRLIWRDPATGRFSQGPLLGTALGRLHTIANAPYGLYIAGERGVAFARLDTPLLSPLRAPGDLPGQVTDIAVDDRYLWVATLRGLVRFRLEVLGR